MQARRTYDGEFKCGAVELAQTSGNIVAKIVRELSISAGLLKQWVQVAKRSGSEAFPSNGRLETSDEEYRRLQRENAIPR